MNTLPFKPRLFGKLLLASCLVFALTGSKAFAAGGGTIDLADISVIQALATQIAAIDKSLTMVGGGSPDPVELAANLAEIDLHLGMMMVTGEALDPKQLRVAEALADLRAKTVMLRERVKEGGGAPDPPNRFMLATTRMILERIDYMRRIP